MGLRGEDVVINVHQQVVLLREHEIKVFERLSQDIGIHPGRGKQRSNVIMGSGNLFGRNFLNSINNKTLVIEYQLQHKQNMTFVSYSN